MTKDYVVESGPNALATFTVQTTPDPKKFGIGVTVPPGFIFPPGIPISVDGNKKATAQYVMCWPDGAEEPAGGVHCPGRGRRRFRHAR